MMVVVVVSRKYGDCPRSVFYLFIRFRPSVYCVFIHLPLVVGIGLVASSTESSIRPRDERKEAVDCGLWMVRFSGGSKNSVLEVENERQRVIVGLIIMMMMMHVGIYELEEEEENGARYLDLVSSQF